MFNVVINVCDEEITKEDEHGESRQKTQIYLKECVQSGPRESVNILVRKMRILLP